MLQIFCLLFSLVLSAQSFNNYIPVYNGSNVNMPPQQKLHDLHEKVYKFIARNTDTSFVSKHLLVNDSIEFDIAFTIGKDGKVMKNHTRVGTQYVFFNEYMKAIINSLPTFKAGELNGRAMQYYFTGKPQYTVTAEKKLQSIFLEPEPIKELSETFRTAPVFPGCKSTKNAELLSCLSKNISEMLNKNINSRKAFSGRLLLTFKITPSGKIDDATVVRGINDIADREVLRVMNDLPRLKPALDAAGNPVEVQFTIPVYLEVSSY